MFINGIKQTFDDEYTVDGYTVTYTGALTLLTTDSVEFAFDYLEIPASIEGLQMWYEAYFEGIYVMRGIGHLVAYGADERFGLIDRIGAADCGNETRIDDDHFNSRRLGGDRIVTHGVTMSPNRDLESARRKYAR